MMNEWNKRIIEEFRKNSGKVGGEFTGATLLLLTTKGRKSGLEYTVPLMYRQEGQEIYVFGSKGGAPKDPDWFHNIKANPVVKVELGKESFTARAEVLSEAERSQIYGKQAQEFPQFAEYQAKTTRKIPVIRLKRR